MCGIVGLFLKDRSLEPQLGSLLTDMLITMTDRGPDSAGIAIYGEENASISKLTVQSDTPDQAFATLEADLGTALGSPVHLRRKDTHAVLHIPRGQLIAARAALAALNPDIRVMSAGDTVEIYKEVGLPKQVAAPFDLRAMSGTHGIGHTRMPKATRYAVPRACRSTCWMPCAPMTRTRNLRLRWGMSSRPLS